MSQYTYPPPPPPEDPVKGKLIYPAMGLIVTGIINIGFSLLLLLSGLARLVGSEPDKTFRSSSERAGYVASQTVTYLAALVSLLLAPLVIYGGIRMMQGKSPALVRAAAVVAMIPLTSCCFLIGVPAGIWAYITVTRPDVADYFERDGAGGGPPYYR
ncbi:MAG TPA: hypothetical protein VFD58_10645 [Blastocatellia bacterium]|nr:hypothetical protein [Blastocatellia bacterium]